MHQSCGCRGNVALSSVSVDGRAFEFESVCVTNYMSGVASVWESSWEAEGTTDPS